MWSREVSGIRRDRAPRRPPTCLRGLMVGTIAESLVTPVPLCGRRCQEPAIINMPHIAAEISPAELLRIRRGILGAHRRPIVPLPFAARAQWRTVQFDPDKDAAHATAACRALQRTQTDQMMTIKSFSLDSGGLLHRFTVTFNRWPFSVKCGHSVSLRNGSTLSVCT